MTETHYLKSATFSVLDYIVLIHTNNIRDKVLKRKFYFNYLATIFLHRPPIG